MRKEKGLSLIEMSISLILALLFVTGTVYAISLAQRFSQAKELANELTQIKEKVKQSRLNYSAGQQINAGDYLHENGRSYNINFGKDDFILVYSTDSSIKWTKDFAYMVCTLIKKDCIFMSGTKIKHISPLFPVQDLKDYMFAVPPQREGFTAGILFKKED